MIFRVFTIYRDAKKGIKDPTGLGRDYLLDFAKGIVAPFFILGFLVIVLFGILGLTDWIAGPYGVFRVFFYVFLFFYIFWGAIIVSIFRRIKKMIDKVKTKADQKFDFDVTPDK